MVNESGAGIMSLKDSRGHSAGGRNGYWVTAAVKDEVWEQIEGGRPVIFTTVTAEHMEVRFKAGVVKSLEFTPGTPPTRS